MISAPILIDPSDESTFPGVGSMADELRSWNWAFGKTPKFSVETLLELTDEQHATRCSAELRMEVKGGRVEVCRLEVPPDWLPERLSIQLSEVLVGERFCPHGAAAAITELLRSESGRTRARLQNLCEVVLAAMG